MAHQSTTTGKHFVRTCKILFEKADDDNSGGLDADEFVKVLQSKALNLRLTRAEIAQVTKFADKDDDGVITFDEFVPIVEQLLNRVAMKKNKKKGHSVCGPADAKNKSRTARQTWKYAKNMVSLTEGKPTLAAAALAAYRLNKRKGMMPSPLEVFELRREGQRAFNEQRHQEAEEIFTVAVEMAAKLKANSPQHITCLMRLAKVVMAQGHVTKSINLYTECLKRLQQVHGFRGNRQTVECAFNLSKVYANVDRLEDAKTHSLDAVNMIDHLTRNLETSTKDREVTPYLKWHAKVMGRMGPSLAAEVTKQQARLIGITIRKFAKQSLATQSEMIKDNLVREVLIGSNGGQFEVEGTGRDDSARSDGNLHNAKANTLYSLGRMLLRQTRLDEAEPLLRQAIGLFEKTKGPMNTELAHAYATLAGCMAAHPNKSRRRTATILLDRSTNILLARGKPLEAAGYGGPLSVKAKLLELMQRFEAATAVMKRVYTILTGHLGMHHPKTDLAKVELDRLGEKCVISGQIKEPNRIRRAARTHSLMSSGRVIKHLDVCQKSYQCPDCGSKEVHLGTRVGATADPDKLSPVCKSCFDSQVALMLSKQRLRSAKRMNSIRVWRQDIERAKEQVGLRLGVTLLPKSAQTS